MVKDVAPGGVGMTLNHMRTCARCGLRYDWRRSPSSSLKMTYCGSLCERADLGFTVEALLKAEPQPTGAKAVEAEAVAAG